MTTVAVIGCTHAGTFATTSILAEHPDWTVHVFERNGTLSFLSCGIALWVGDHVSDPKKMFYSSPAALAEAGATMHMRTDVTSVDLDARTLTYRALDEAGDPAEQTLAFDKLVVTTGSRPVIPPIPGIDSPHVLSMPGIGGMTGREPVVTTSLSKARVCSAGSPASSSAR